jgi:hypothetical protein
MEEYIESRIYDYQTNVIQREADFPRGPFWEPDLDISNFSSFVKFLDLLFLILLRKHLAERAITCAIVTIFLSSLPELQSFLLLVLTSCPVRTARLEFPFTSLQVYTM